jgi:hypothetical protein
LINDPSFFCALLSKSFSFLFPKTAKQINAIKAKRERKREEVDERRRNHKIHKNQRDAGKAKEKGKSLISLST